MDRISQKRKAKSIARKAQGMELKVLLGAESAF